MQRRVSAAFAVLCAVALGGIVWGQSLPKLVDEIKLTRTADSPGQVVFNHSTHVDSAKPECMTCHPSDFSILGAKGNKRQVVAHKNFEAGRQCGRCHDGKKAFAVADDCTNCHQS